jgi:hypothetical protein
MPAPVGLVQPRLVGFTAPAMDVGGAAEANQQSKMLELVTGWHGEVSSLRRAEPRLGERVAEVLLLDCFLVYQND